MRGTALLLQWLQCLHGAHARHQLMIRKMLAMPHRRNNTTHLIQCFRPTQTTARTTCHVAATLFECDETFRGNLQMHQQTIIAGLDLNFIQLRGLRDDAFGQRKTQRKIFQIIRRGQHHHMRDAVVLQRHRHFDCQHISRRAANTIPAAQH